MNHPISLKIVSFAMASLVLLLSVSMARAGAAGQDYKKYLSQKKELETALSIYRGADQQRALPVLERLAKKGNPVAAYLRLSLLAKTETSPQKKKEFSAQAAGLIPAVRALAEQNDPVAQNLMGTFLASGESGGVKNLDESTGWFRKAAEQGYAQAQLNLGWAYTKGEGIKKNPEEAAAWFRKAADQGNAGGQAGLALAYSTGKGLKTDLVEAFKWYSLAAEQGHPEGEFQKAYFYYYGLGTERNPAEALKLFLKCAERGEAFAQFFAGLCYATGKGTEKDPREAFNWYRKAAAQGHDIAQMDLSTFYADGFGTEKNFEESLQWTAKAAEQGYAPAQGRLGMVYLDGMGVPRDPAEGVKWLRRAAEKGDPLAQYTLGKACQAGDGTGKDPEEALKWYQKAADQKLEKARDALAALQKEEKSFSGTFKRWGRASKRKLSGLTGKKTAAVEEKAASLMPPSGTNMDRWKIHLLPFGKVSHVLPDAFAVHKTSVLEPNPGITRQFSYQDAAGLTAVLIVTKIRADYPKDDSLLDKSRADNEALLQKKGPAAVSLSTGLAGGRRFEEMSVLNWEYQESFPHSINLNNYASAENPKTSGNTAVFVRDGLFIEAALHLRAAENETGTEITARLRELSRQWLESFKVETKL